MQAAARLEDEVGSQENDDLDLLLAVSTQRYGDDSFVHRHNDSDWHRSRAAPIGLRAISRAEAITHRQLRVNPSALDDTVNIGDDELRKMAALIGPSDAREIEGEEQGARAGSGVECEQGVKPDQHASDLEVLKRENKNLRAQIVNIMLQNKRQKHGDPLRGIGQPPLAPSEGSRDALNVMNDGMLPSAAAMEYDWRQREERHCSKRARGAAINSGDAITDPLSQVQVDAHGLARGNHGEEMDTKIQELIDQVSRLQAAQEKERSLNAERHQEILRLLPSPS